MSRLLVAQRALTVPGWAKDALWRRAGAVPSLDLRFADSKSLVDATTGSNLVTFTRASSGTFVGSDGVLRTAVTNLLTFSEQFDNAAWSVARCTISANTSIAPDGLTTGDTLVEDTTSNSHPVFRTISGLANGAAYTASVYIKASARNRSRVALANSAFAANTYVDFNLAAVTATGNNATGSITQLGDGWYRCTVTATTIAAASGDIFIQPQDSGGATSYLGTGVNALLIWGAQLEQSSSVGEYIPTTSTINSAPRFDHNPTTGESLGLLVEEQRTNLALWSQAIDLTNWATQQATFQTLNAAASPSGALNASLLYENTQTAPRFIGQSIAVTNAAHTVSIFAKAKERRRIMFRENTTSGTSATFDLQSGTVVGSENSPTTSIQSYGNGWYRCVMTYTPSSASTRLHAVYLMPDSGTSFATSSYTGDGASGLYLFGFQLEVGSGPPTSYIPTTTATVTRSADVCSDTTRGGNIRSLYVQFRSPASGTRPVVSLDDNTANERIEILTSGTDPKLLVTDGGSAVADLDAGTVSANTTARIAARFQTDDYGVSIDGATSQLDAAGTLPTATRVRIGSNQAGGYLNGTIARITGWESALPLLPPVSG